MYRFPCKVAYRGADKSLARPTSLLFDGQNISFDASLVIYINSTNIPPIMIINRIHEHQNLLSLQLLSFLVGLRTYQHLCTITKMYRGVDQSLARPTSRRILFDGQNISFDASLVIYTNSTNIPPIMIINRIHEHQNLPSLQLLSFLVGLRTYQHHANVVTVRLHVLSLISLSVGQISRNLIPYTLALHMCWHIYCRGEKSLAMATNRPLSHPTGSRHM